MAYRLQIVIVNRLILNLNHGANAREDSEFRTRTGLEPPAFVLGPVLGNIGGSVRTFPDDLDNAEEILDDEERVDADNAEHITAEHPVSTNIGAGSLNGIIELHHGIGVEDV